MRSPSDMRSFQLPLTRRRRFLVGIVVAVIAALASLRTLATFWTDQLWFSSEHQGGIFRTLFEVKAGLIVVFGLSFFFAAWLNMLLAVRYGSRDLSFEPEDEFVRMLQSAIRPFARRLYAAIAAVMGLIAGFAAMPQWNSFVLFTHAQRFGTVDPLFGKDPGFYVFRLPFYRFIDSWVLGSLVVITLLSTVVHYVNGGIRATRGAPRVSPHVKVHLSILLAAIALTKAVGYVLGRYALAVAQDGYVNGANYTDVHARVPAYSILFWMSLASAAILLANIARRGWSLPALSAALWAFVALVIGVIYPAALQTFKVTPAQSSLELPYIQRDIAATRFGYGLQHVATHPFTVNASVSSADLRAAATTLGNIGLWDTDPSISLETVQRRQAIQSYYQFTTLAVDRYRINGVTTPVLIGARQLNQDNLPSQSWVNQRLAFTHGYGMVVMPGNQFDPLTGNPNFVMQNIPPQSAPGFPTLTQPSIYYGINNGGWVVANSHQAELDYKNPAGVPVESHYQGTGGVQLSSFLRRSAFALRLNDLNLWISNDITSKSRLIFNRDVLQIAKNLAPFLSFDSNPYAVVVNGHVDYVVDGYTTTSQYPYAQNASTLNLNPVTGLPESYNYVRNSVKIVIDAYDGSTSMYAFDPNDPILTAYRSAFPSLFQPLSSMPQAVRDHLRYPSDLFSAQSAVWGRYHIGNASDFYNASDRWQVSPTTGAGAPGNGLLTTQTVNAQGQIISTSATPMDPTYQVNSLPGESTQQLTLLNAFVPRGNTSASQNLTAFMMATSGADNYGQLNVYVTPRGTTVTGPIQAASSINSNAKVSPILSLLNQHGSRVLLGHILMVPLRNSILYVRPLYVTSTAVPLPQLKYVVAVFNSDVGIEPSLGGALSDVLGGSVNSGGTSPSGSAASYIAQASAEYAQAQNQLRAGNLAGYQSAIQQMANYLQLAQAALAAKH